MLRKIKAWIYRNSKEHCKSCGNKLTEYEKEYYGVTCEKCEQFLLEKMKKHA